MAQSGLVKAYSELPAWAKGVIAVGGLAVAVALGFTARNIIRKISANKRGKGAISQADDYLREMAKKGIRPSYSDFQYKTWADTLHAAMNGVGTTTGQIGSIMSLMKNDADLAKLVQAFDVRTIKSGIVLVPDNQFNLVSALADELNTMEIDQINYALHKKGITYKF